VFVGRTDTVNKVTTGYAFPPSDSTTTTDEFIGEIVAPIGVRWAGAVPGGAMNNNLLLVAWPNGNEIISSARFAT
jgi:cellobiose dehydrogenase (acceptor)